MVEASDIEQAPSMALSRPFDVHRWSDYPELQNCLTQLIRELEALEAPRERKRGEGQRKKFREALRCLVLDLYVAWKTEPDLAIGIPLANDKYTANSRYRALFLHWSSFKAAYDLLVAAGYIVVVMRHFHDPRTGIGRTTRIRATNKLIRLLTEEAQLTIPSITSRTSEREVIILRGEKPKGGSDKPAPLIEYDDTDDTNAMRASVDRINAHLQRQWIDVRIKDKDFERLQHRMQREYLADNRDRHLIDFTQRALVRIFNNGDWQQGGRFYRGWWQGIPKEYRKHITINDKPTRELDYSTLHPVLLYAAVGERLDGDAYSIDAPDVPRSLVKITFNKMLNASGRIDKPADFSDDRIGMDWKQLQNAIAARHAPIRRFFNTGHGLYLQRQDSDLAQAVMLRFITGGHTCLPVHDSFLVHHALVDELKSVMVDEFKAMTGQAITVRSLNDFELEPEPDYQPAAQSMLPDNAWFEGIGEYAAYEQRKIDWYSNAHGAGRP